MYAKHFRNIIPLLRRESDELSLGFRARSQPVYGRTVPLVRQVVRPTHTEHGGEARHRKADLVDGAVEELLFGW
jgi:hypothetical protein